MASFNLRPAARLDLENIWTYSANEWGEQPADAYIRQINETFTLLAAAPEMSRDCSNIRPSYRKHPVGRHMIYYRLDVDGEIDIVRILHQRMDVERHLPD